MSFERRRKRRRRLAKHFSFSSRFRGESFPSREGGGNWVETIFLREDHPDLRGEGGVGGREGVEAVHWIIARR